MLTAYLSGIGTGAGLIIAIGAQNAFVLVQAIRREYHYITAGICALLDALLISAGVLGVGTLVASNNILRIGAGIGGAIFLAWFGFNSLKAAFTVQKMSTNKNATKQKSLKKTILAVLAVSLLNPHVYLDTVIMLGAISGNYAGYGRYFFGLGAITSSFIWFFSLAKCGTLLASTFARPKSWQILNTLVCVMVWLVALGLIIGVYKDLKVILALS